MSTDSSSQKDQSSQPSLPFAGPSQPHVVGAGGRGLSQNLSKPQSPHLKNESDNAGSTLSSGDNIMRQ